jgi:hypothetical protein
MEISCFSAGLFLQQQHNAIVEIIHFICAYRSECSAAA